MTSPSFHYRRLSEHIPNYRNLMTSYAARSS